MRFIITEYIEKAIEEVTYDKLSDGTFVGRILECVRVVSFGKTLKEAEEELRYTFEDWILVGLKLGHTLPIIDGINLNMVPEEVEISLSF